MPLNCVVVDADPANRQELADFLSEHGATVSAILPSLDRLPAALQQAEGHQLVLVNLDPGAHETLKRVGDMIREYPSVNFFVLSKVVDPQLLIDAIHIRVKEFIALPMSSEKLLAGIERILHAEGDTRGKVIHVIPTIGGCGATSISCNVAASLAKNHKTVLVDMDLIRGSAATSFDVHPKFTIADVISSGGTLDKHLLNNALAVHAGSGLSILARPELPEDSQKVSRVGLGRLLNVLTGSFDYVILDSVMSLDPVYLAAIESADVNLLVMQMNIPSARNAERFVTALKRLDVDAGRVKVVVNRFDRRAAELSPEDIEKNLGLKVAWTIPNDFKNSMAAINFGQPLVLRAPRAEVSGSYQGLVQMLNGRSGGRN
ncbi:MAG: AAA family ATPase [Tepidisphaeraceae bacterium]